MNYNELAEQLLKHIYFQRKNNRQHQINEFFQGEAFILQYVYQHKDGVFPNDISNSMSITTGRVAAALNSLEKKGFINREIYKNDRRQILVTLTQAGKEMAENQRNESIQRIIKMFESLGEHDAKEYVRIMGKLAGLSSKKNRGEENEF